MIYPSDFEDKIGFSAIREYLAGKTISPMGVRACDSMMFSCDVNLIARKLAETEEMVRIIRNAIDIPLENFHDVIPFLKEIKSPGSYMISERLQKLKTSVETMAKIRSFFAPDSDGNYKYPALSANFSKLKSFPQIVKIIDAVIDKYGEIKNNASPQLASVRSSIAAVNASMTSVMRRVIERAVADGYVESGTLPSVRDGRLVIPVASMMKRKINGIIHDESATGKTAYVEPAVIVEANNRLRELENEERREIIRILTSVADNIRPEIHNLIVAYNILGDFDFIRAKALVAIELDAQLPALSQEYAMEWFHAVHPVLAISLKAQGRKIVPLDISLGQNHRILIISGPNAGGKSVCLKTVGIVQYMMQCGMLPTLYSNSRMCIFDKIFIDIGDEQSMENDLSTYSSHLRNMKYFMANADETTLILADEMGSGTEPQIGGALAQAILMDLNSKNVRGVITTHYQNLKTFAESEDGFVNGAMLYDRQHLQPLFQLSIGNPGSSFAIEIARKTGLPASVIENAESIVGSDYVNMDKYLLDIARDRRYWANKRLAVKEKERRLDDILNKSEERADSIRQQRSEILRLAREEAREIVDGVNAKIERTILEIRKRQAEKEQTKKLRKELEEYSKSILADNNTAPDPEILKPQKKNKRKHGGVQQQSSAVREKKEFKVGDYVRMSDNGVIGHILSIDNSKAEVAFGALRTIVKTAKLQHASRPKVSANTLKISRTTSDEVRSRQLEFHRELDVRGMRVDEALQSVTYFLDDAIQFSSDRVRILHGTGTGALRMAIRSLLEANADVESYHDEDVRFGGAGITVINLR